VLLINKHEDSSSALAQNDPVNTFENKLNAHDTSGLETTFNFNGSNILYLNDVLLALNNQNWTEEEKPCFDKTVWWLRELKNFTLWAVWDWDAISSEPQGLLFGSRFHLGNYNECMNAPWRTDRPELRTQYCLADISLHRTGDPLKNGISDPYDPYQSALNLIEHVSIFRRPLNQLTWGVCVPAVCHRNSVVRLMGILLAHSHLGAAGLRADVTVPDECQKAGVDTEYDILFYTFILVCSCLIVINIICTVLNRPASSLRGPLTNAFDLRGNARDVLKVKKSGLETLYGIRFLTMSLIVIAHQKVTSLFGLLLIHADLLVDTFFLVSGLLTAFTVTKINVRLNIILSLFLKRYLRLVVAYALVIYYVSAVYPYTGSGPLWHRAVAQDTVQCRKNWWLSLLMLGNYVDTDNMMFTYDFMTNFRGPRQFQITYIKSHTRYAAYLIGFFTGCIIEKYSKDTVKRISQKWAIIGSCVGFTTMMVTQLTGSMVLWREFTAIESALYAAFNRPIWACGAALFTLSCVFGNVPLVNSFLRWYPWVPLSRLSYGVYLVHSVIILRDVSFQYNIL
ncbi:unnamed protein product, partial [Leptidea sinapis]